MAHRSRPETPFGSRAGSHNRRESGARRAQSHQLRFQRARASRYARITVLTWSRSNPKFRASFSIAGVSGWIARISPCAASRRNPPRIRPSGLRRPTFIIPIMKIGDFWLPSENQSVSAIRGGGHAVLTIKYQNYEILAARGLKGSDTRSILQHLPSPYYPSEIGKSSRIFENEIWLAFRCRASCRRSVDSSADQ